MSWQFRPECNYIISASRAIVSTKHPWLPVTATKTGEPEKFPRVLAWLKNYNFIQFKDFFIVLCVSQGEFQEKDIFWDKAPQKDSSKKKK